MAVSIDRSLERAPVGRQPPRTPLESNRAALVEIHSRLFSLFYPGPRLLSQPLVSSQRRISTKKLEDRALGSWGFYNWTLLAVLLIRITERVFENNPI